MNRGDRVLTPTRLLNEIKQNKVSTVVADMPVYKGMEIFAADAETKVIEGATDDSKIGEKLDAIGISSAQVDKDQVVVTHVKIDGKHCRCMTRWSDSYIVAVTVEDSVYLQGTLLAILIVGIYLVLATCWMMYMLSKVIKERVEKEKLIYTSNTDELTKCFNRHAYEKDINNLDLSEEWIYISMDLNGLKHVNDSFGHAAGDELICAAAGCMKNSFGQYGKVYRIGGDEFVVVITKNIEQFEEELGLFEHRVEEWHGKFVDSMTISYGYVFSSEKKWNSVYDIAKVADKRMYESKANFYREKERDRRK